MVLIGTAQPHGEDVKVDSAICNPHRAGRDNSIIRYTDIYFQKRYKIGQYRYNTASFVFGDSI